MSVDIQTEPRFRASSPEELFQGKYIDYDVGRDGRLLLIEPENDDDSLDMLVIFNWFEELKRKFAENECIVIAEV